MGFLEHDVEKTGDTKLYTDEVNAVPGESFEVGNSFYAKAQRLAGRFSIEQRGIERVPENERTDKSLVKVGTMVCKDVLDEAILLLTDFQWLAANMVVSSFAIGTLGPNPNVYDMGFADSILTILFINILGITPVCFFSTFGPKFGLRQMVLSRFYFGWYGVKISKPRQSKSRIDADQDQLPVSISWLALDGLL